MADAKITELTAIDAVAGGDLIPIVDDPAGTPATKKATASQIKDYIVALANTWTATQTIDPADNTSALAVSGFSLTGSNAQSILDLAGTWNTTGTPTAIKLNVTDTASNSASLLMDLQRGGVTQFSVRRDGVVVATNSYRIGNSIYAGGSVGFSSDAFLTRIAAAHLRLGSTDAAAPVAQTLSVQSVVAGTSNTAGAAFTITGSQGTGTGAGGSIIFQVAPAGLSGTSQNALATALTINSTLVSIFGGQVGAVSFSGATGAYSTIAFHGTATNNANAAVRDGVGFTIRAASRFGWVSDTHAGNGTVDLSLFRDAANTLALRNGTNAQAFRVYSTYTDASNYERGALNAGADYIELAAETAGTGDDNLDVRLTPAGTGNVRFGTHSAVGGETVTGYIEIKDAGGTVRKLAVVS